jgi:hypothetical protein
MNLPYDHLCQYGYGDDCIVCGAPRPIMPDELSHLDCDCPYCGIRLRAPNVVVRDIWRAEGCNVCMDKHHSRAWALLFEAGIIT